MTRATSTGRFVAHTGAHLVQAAADTGVVCRWALWNPIGSGAKIALQYIEYMTQNGSALATPTSPRIILARFTFTANGTPSATVITPAKVETAFTQVAQLRVLTTGLTGPALGADVHAFLPVVALTAVGSAPPGAADYCPPLEDQIVLAPGEGVLLQQRDAGTTSDTRRYTTNIGWEEYT